MRKFLLAANRPSGWSQVHAVVADLGVSGYSAADGLLSLGAGVTVLDGSDTHTDKAAILKTLNTMMRLGRGATAKLPRDMDLVVTPPGWRPDTPLLTRVLECDIPVWGGIEFARRTQQPDRTVPWLEVVDTNGKTTITQMAESILRAVGTRAAAVGNAGHLIVKAILDDEPCDALVIELSSFQLHWVHAVAFHSAAAPNLYEDRLRFYNGPGGYECYVANEIRILEWVANAYAYNVTELETRYLMEEVKVTKGAHAIGFITGTPVISMIDVVDGLIVDHVFIAQWHSSVLELAKIVNTRPYAPCSVVDVCTAAALVHGLGVLARSVAQGPRGLRPAGHRIVEVAEISGVRWIDDSEATSPHTADSVTRAFLLFVRVAGGQTKGTSFDEPITTHRDRIRVAILIGVDWQVIAGALFRYAPDVPMIILDSSDYGVMDKAVSYTAHLVHEGDAVSPSPGSASLSMFMGYDNRGECSVDAVRSPQASSS